MKTFNIDSKNLSFGPNNQIISPLTTKALMITTISLAKPAVDTVEAKTERKHEIKDKEKKLPAATTPIN